jgi:hypothetical protein
MKGEWERPFGAAKRRLRNWNYGVAAVHATSFVALTAISFTYEASATRARLWTDFDGANLVEVANYPLFATLLPFPAITAFFHLLAAWNVDNYYQSVLMRGLNRLRWVEYAITNSLITASLLTLVGAGNVFLFVAGILSNIVMQYFGYLHEKVNHRSDTRVTTLMPLFAGFLPFFAIWVPTVLYTINGISSAPAFEIVAVFGSLLFAVMFVVPLWVRYETAGSGALELKANYNMELFYIILSLTAKLFLDWTVTINTIVVAV